MLVDARGHRCPIPTLRLRRACERAPPGASVRLLSDDPMARIDAPHFAAQAGLELVSLKVTGSLVSVVIRKPLMPSPETRCGAPVGGDDAPPG